MLRPISVDFCLTFDANYRVIMLRPIFVDFCLTFDANYRNIMLCEFLLIFALLLMLTNISLSGIFENFIIKG